MTEMACRSWACEMGCSHRRPGEDRSRGVGDSSGHPGLGTEHAAVRGSTGSKGLAAGRALVPRGSQRSGVDRIAHGRRLEGSQLGHKNPMDRLALGTEEAPARPLQDFDQFNCHGFHVKGMNKTHL